MLKKLLVILLSLFVMASCSDKPWEEMNLDEQAKAFLKMSFEKRESTVKEYLQNIGAGPEKLNSLYEKLDDKGQEDLRKIFPRAYFPGMTVPFDSLGKNNIERVAALSLMTIEEKEKILRAYLAEVTFGGPDGLLYDVYMMFDDKNKEDIRKIFPEFFPEDKPWKDMTLDERVKNFEKLHQTVKLTRNLYVYFSMVWPERTKAEMQEIYKALQDDNDKTSWGGVMRYF